MLDGIGILDNDIFAVFNTNDVVVGPTTIYMEGLHILWKGFPFLYIRYGNDSVFQTTIFRHGKIKQKSMPFPI